MLRTTIFTDEASLREIKDISRHENRPVSEIIREALSLYINLKKAPAKKLSIIGIGESERMDISEAYEDLLWQETKFKNR